MKGKRKKHCNVGKDNGMFGVHRIGKKAPCYGKKFPKHSKEMKGNKFALKYSISKEFLIREYIINKKSMEQIAKELKCSYTPIRDRLIEFNIPIKSKSEAHKGIKCLKHSKKMIELWKTKKYREKTLKASMLGRQIKPNKFEKQLARLLNKILPKEYKFVGDGKIIIDRFCPDFINCDGQKKIIELFGDYWHNLSDYKKRDKRRLKTYKKYGYKTLVVWEYELKDLDKLKRKVLKFNG